MVLEKNILGLIEEFNSGLDGAGPILWHKKLHKNGSGEFACVKGIKDGCFQPVNCKDCYFDKTGGYCLQNKYYSVPVEGFLVVESKHQKLVANGVIGAYSSILEAIKNLD